MSAKRLHLSKASLPIDIIPDGLPIDMSEPQPENAFSPMTLRPEGFPTEDNSTQSVNAPKPIRLTLLGIDALVSLIQL